MTAGARAVLTTGLRATVRAVVTEADTATALGSGDVPVLGTPRLLALAETATLAAIGSYLEPERTSVGTAVRMEHKRAAAVGEELVVEAELTAVDGRRLEFSFVAWAGDPAADLVVGAGTIERVVVRRERFSGR
ncbi:MAG TPA: hotdog domain-containing protein [Streptosporangiaceae bacterium]|jgi:predicted thioesterase